VVIGMFDRNKNKQMGAPSEDTLQPRTSAASVSPGRVNVRSEAMIGPSIVIKGAVSGDEDLFVQGKVEGSIELTSHEVTVGQSGRVMADIKAKVVKVDGEVSGDITGIETVVISKSGSVRGNIVAPRVTLEDGAMFKGSIDMDPGEEAGATVSLATKKPSKPVVSSELVPGRDLKSG
jgi:cytoskeletal protein CcmA (bactofilin family)